MENLCKDFTLVQLRNIARQNNISGFSKLRKDELCLRLSKLNLIGTEKKPVSPRQVRFANVEEVKVIPTRAEKPEIPTPVIPSFGIEPPSWDFDRGVPIPEFLQPYDYVYAAGSSDREIARFWILPDNFPLVAEQLPTKDGRIPLRYFEVTVADYHSGVKEYEVNGEILEAWNFYIRGPGTRGKGYSTIAPKIGTKDWFYFLQTHQIIDMAGTGAFNPQLRRNHRIIQELYAPPFDPADYN